MAGRGPLPNPNARRRNSPTIPTTALPASGRRGRPPTPPHGARLGKAGRAWWAWAWSLPQSFGWSKGDHSALARRASLEDDLAAMGTIRSLDAMELYGEAAEDLKDALRNLAGIASGKLAIQREMRELDNRFGLTPKGLADLRWTIVDDTAKTEEGDGGNPNPGGVVKLRAV